MYNHLPSPVRYREDINGLRGYAIIAVMLFHFTLIGLPGGFAGVDVFFVISGYLMTSIVVSGYEGNNFSLIRFYMARARRILPALMVLVAVLFILGWFLLPTVYYQDLAHEGFYGLLFSSNIYYWREIGYFNPAAHEKWLLHTWSLAVEAQFYVLYPLFVALVWRWFWKSSRALFIGLFFIFIISFLINLMLSYKLPTAAFYLFPARSWELAAGGLVFFLARQVVLSEVFKSMAYWLGWALILTSFVILNEKLIWPGYLAMLPVSGTALIILANRPSCKLTNNSTAQWLGNISFSLYLWHWPMVVALYFLDMQTAWVWVASAFVLSVLIAQFSYSYVEVPTRRLMAAATLKLEFAMIGGFVILLILVSLILFKVNFSSRFDVTADIAAAEKNNWNKDVYACRFRFYSESHAGCVFKGDKFTTDFQIKPDVILIGDSHAQMIASALSHVAEKYDKNILTLTANGCSFQFNDLDQQKLCQPVNVLSKKIVEDYPKAQVVLNSAYYSDLFSSYDDFERSYVDTVCSYAANRDVYLIQPLPPMTVNVPKEVTRRILLGELFDDVKVAKDYYYEKADWIFKAQDKAGNTCGAKLLKVEPYLCDGYYCYGSRDNRPLYVDASHLSEFGNRLLLPMFKDIFDER